MIQELKKDLKLLNKSDKRRLEQSIRMKEQQAGKIFTEEHKKNIGKGRISLHRKAVIIDDIEYPAQKNSIRFSQYTYDNVKGVD